MVAAAEVPKPKRHSKIELGISWAILTIQIEFHDFSKLKFALLEMGFSSVKNTFKQVKTTLSFIAQSLLLGLGKGLSVGLQYFSNSSALLFV